MSTRLRQLADDWDHYGTIHDAEWRDEMRRAIVVELKVEVDRLARECADTPPAPPTTYQPVHKSKLARRVRRMMRSHR